MDLRKVARHWFHRAWPTWLPVEELRIRHCGYQVLLDPSDHCAREIFVRYLLRRRWVHESFQQSVTQRLLSRFEQAWFVDGGASYGMYTLLAAQPSLEKHVDRVISIEASPRTFGWLRKTIEVNQLQSRVTLFNNAISNSDGQELHFQEHPEFSEWSRVNPAATGGTANGLPVISRRGDSLLGELGWVADRPLFIKIDIEGGEPDALQGAASLLAQAVDFVAILEFQTHLLDLRPRGCDHFAQQIHAIGAPYVTELNEANKSLTPLLDRSALEAIVKRLRSGKKLREYMTNIVLSTRPIT